MTIPTMDATTGLLPGQSWNVAHGPLWQARLDRGGRAHVVGFEPSVHPDYRAGYRDGGPQLAGHRTHATASYERRWHADYSRAMRAARSYNRMRVAAERQGVE